MLDPPARPVDAAGMKGDILLSCVSGIELRPLTRCEKHILLFDGRKSVRIKSFRVQKIVLVLYLSVFVLGFQSNPIPESTARSCATVYYAAIVFITHEIRYSFMVSTLDHPTP